MKSYITSTISPNFINAGKGSLKPYMSYLSLDNSNSTVRYPVQYSLYMGGTGYVTTPPGAVYNRVFGSWTVEFWVKFNNYVPSGSRFNALFTNRGASTGGSMIFLAGDVLSAVNKKICFDADDNAGTQEVASVTTVGLGIWYHIAVSFEFRGGSTNEVKLYINGQLEATNSACVSLTPPNDGATVGTWIGAENGIGAPFGLPLDGNMADVRLWNTVRTSDQIATNKNKPLNGNEPGLVNYFPFREGVGGNTMDVKGGVVGTLNSTTWSLDNPFKYIDPMAVYRTAESETKQYYTNLTANGGSISASSLNSVNELVKDLKLYGIWNKLEDIGIFCGDNLNSALTKLKGAQTSYLVNHNFVDADYVERGSTGGLKGNGTTKFLDSGFNVTLRGSANYNDLSIGLYWNGTAGGVELGEDNLDRFNLFVSAGNVAVATTNVYVTGRTIAGGLGIGTRLPGTNLSASWNGDFSTWVTADLTSSLFNETCYIFARNENSVATSVSSNRICYYHFGKGLTQTDCGNYYNILQRFQRSLGRQYGI